MADCFEIERRFLIKYPSLEQLRAVASETEIVQTYLKSDDGQRARVRKRGLNGNYVYTHTVKQRINDLKRIENEREIDRDEYEALLHKADAERNVIYKRRFCLGHEEHLFEIDVYSFWDDRALMEVELKSEDECFELPPIIEIVREVTSDGRYTNASLAKTVPMDEI